MSLIPLIYRTNWNLTSCGWGAETPPRRTNARQGSFRSDRNLAAHRRLGPRHRPGPFEVDNPSRAGRRMRHWASEICQPDELTRARRPRAGPRLSLVNLRSRSTESPRHMLAQPVPGLLALAGSLAPVAGSGSWIWCGAEGPSQPRQRVVHLPGCRLTNDGLVARPVWELILRRCLMQEPSHVGTWRWTLKYQPFCWVTLTSACGAN